MNFVKRHLHTSVFPPRPTQSFGYSFILNKNRFACSFLYSMVPLRHLGSIWLSAAVYYEDNHKESTKGVNSIDSYNALFQFAPDTTCTWNDHLLLLNFLFNVMKPLIIRCYTRKIMEVTIFMIFL